MAFAPLSQILLLTEDGSVIPATQRVTIPVARLLPPIIIIPADIAGDENAQVGKQLTGIDPVATFATYGNRRWLRGETVLARTVDYTPISAGDIDWVVDVIGTDGVTVLISAKRVSVAAIPVLNPTINDTDETSTLDASLVAGALALFAEMDAIFAEIGAANDDSQEQLADLDSRLSVLEK